MTGMMLLPALVVVWYGFDSASVHVDALRYSTPRHHSCLPRAAGAASAQVSLSPKLCKTFLTLLLLYAQVSIYRINYHCAVLSSFFTTLHSDTAYSCVNELPD